MGILNDIYNQTKLCDVKKEAKNDDKGTKDKETKVSDKEKKEK